MIQGINFKKINSLKEALMDKAELLKRLVDEFKESDPELLKRFGSGENGTAEDGMGILVTDLLVGAAEQVRKASGSMEPEGPDLSSVENSIQKYQDLLRGGAGSKDSAPHPSKPQDEIKN
ncbi:MAG: hypothetical protein LBJ15_22215 [Comamonas sp.]|uniref:hypothetical protein n=1 Tax=Comamonas sp. TaxID=34028 RepID=UPI00281F5414|nr:hypothetical protein [Comamonas sp.]MDR0216699.1 hypothetical protein [Comamonas sp.]